MPRARKGAGRFGRTIRSLIAITALGAGLALYNAYSIRRDDAMATGPKSDAQHAFFLASVDRPDIDLFFKHLTHAQRLTVAERIGEYDDPQFAALIGALLGSFDGPVREILTSDLAKIAREHPAPVAEQLKQKGSLQVLAVSTALHSVGNSALPSVAAQLKVADARPNAVALLVSAGEPSVRFLLPFLNDADKDVRLASADALGKIGAKSAVPALVAKYGATQDDERFGYLSAIAAIGARETEGLLSAAADDASLSTPRRAQAMLGLGRIGSATAITKLWSFADDDDVQMRDAMISALQLAGNRGLSVATRPDLGLRIAAGIKSPESTAYIARMLSDPATMRAAAEVAANRRELVPDLVAALKRTTDGAAIDAGMRALMSTPEGEVHVKRLEADPTLGGFAMRRLRLSKG